MKYEMIRVLTVGAVVVSLSFFATGCAQKTVRTDGQSAGQTSGQANGQAMANQQDGGEAMGAEESLSSATSSSRATETNTYSEGRTSGELLPVYFDFDQSGIRNDQRGRIDGNAYYLKNNSRSVIRIEGNCDERGTNEYNMALGERRARAAMKYLLNMGISEDRLKTVSFGEEKPLVYGHDELSWAQNRRDDFFLIK